MTSAPLGSPFILSPELRAASAAGRDAIASSDIRAGWFTATMLAGAALTLGLALQVNFGQYHPTAMRWLSIALLACLAAVVVPNFGRVIIGGWRPDQLLLAIALAVQFALLWVTEPAATLKLATADELDPFRAGAALAAALVAVGVSGTRVARYAVPLLLLAHVALGVWVI